MVFRRNRQSDSENLNDIADALAGTSTPFGALKTASQELQFSINPQFGLTRERYFWDSNGSDFDSTNFTENPGEITLSTTATGTDTARLRSSYAGQYISQTISEPGIEVTVDSSNVNLDSSTGEASLTHGEVLYGPFFYDSGNTKVDTGFGVRLNSTDVSVFWKSDGSHKGDSPVSQSNWNIDTLDGSGDYGTNPSGIQYDPSDGWVFNGIYWWYNAGKILLAFADPVNNTLIPFHEFNPRVDSPGAPSLKSPNLPVQIRIDNSGTASSLTASVGGVQYTSYGSNISTGRQLRETPIIILDASVTTLETDDPTSTPGEYITAVRKKSGNKDLETQTANLTVQTDQTITMYQWLEFDDSTALSGTPNFTDPNVENASDETKMEYDTAATGYSPTEAVLETAFKFEGGGGPSSTVVRGGSRIEKRIPIGGTRVYTGVDRGNDATVDLIVDVREGF